LKLKNYIKVISDTNECLMIEPENIKALIRKAQEAYDTFEKVIDIDQSNQIAHQEMFDLRKKLPSRKAFRMKIEEIYDCEVEQETKTCQEADSNETGSSKSSQNLEQKPQKYQQTPIIRNSEKLDLPDSTHIPKMVKNIVIEEATPFDKLTPKVKEKQRETLILPGNVEQRKKNVLIQEIN
jgi:hypothetical protein